MKPLVIIISYNRLQILEQTFRSLEATTEGLQEIELVIIDNGSQDGSKGWLSSNIPNFVHLHLLPINIGCPQALNMALSLHRRVGQPVVKIDNDIDIQTPGWVEIFKSYEEAEFLVEAMQRPVAMIAPWHEGIERHKVIEHIDDVWILMGFIPGHFCWHTARFMDEVGYFDVLADDHYYGFEDKLMCDKANLMGWLLLVDKRVQIINLQRNYSYALFGKEKKDEHVERLRPIYHKRLDDYQWRRRPFKLDLRGGLE